MKTASSHDCPQCGQRIAGGLQGLCPKCLALVGFGPSADPADTQTLDGVLDIDLEEPLSPLSRKVEYFGDYELIEEIARGGMGVVFKARQRALNRVVAVKMIRSGRLAGDRDVKRLRTEAEAAASLQHPNIVAIHEVGEHDGQHYFSMDLVEGPTLEACLQEGPLPAGRAAQYLKTLAEAVGYAHSKGILHRDLKPSNVLLDAEDRVRITDFGLAKVMYAESDLTRSRDVMGSPAYMAPEQAMAEHDRIGPHSDVYSLGALLYHLLTGRPPFQGENALETLHLALEQDPEPPSSLNPKVSADLETICLKCLAKEPGQRYGTAAELAGDLDRFLNYEPILAKPAGVVRKSWSWVQKNPWAVAGTFALFGLLVAGLAYGLFERVRFLEWRQLGLELPSVPLMELPSVWFLRGLPLLAALLWIGRRAFRRGHAQTAGDLNAPSVGAVWGHAAIGLVALLTGLGAMLALIRAWAWDLGPGQMLWLEIPALVAALILQAAGFFAVWEAVGVHESSRFREAVGRSLNRSAHHPLWRLVGMPLWISLLAILGVGAVLEWTSRWPCWKSTVCLGLIAASTWLGYDLGKAVARHARLLTRIWIPFVAWCYLLVFVGCFQGFGRGGLLFGHSMLLAGVAAVGGYFLGRPPGRDPNRTRFPIRPMVDIPLALLIAAIPLLVFQGIENLRGRNAWNRVQAELASQGESLALADFLAAPVPASENVFEHPYAKRHFVRGGPSTGRLNFPIPFPPFASKNQPGQPLEMSFLHTLPEVELRQFETHYQTYQADFAQISEAFERPHSQLPYDPKTPLNKPIPDFVAFRMLGQHHVNLARVHLLLGDRDAYLGDLRALRRTAEIVRGGKPRNLVGTMIHVAILGLLGETIRDGLRQGEWTEAQLAVLQELALLAEPLPGQLGESFRSERAALLQHWHQVRDQFLQNPQSLADIFVSRPKSGLHGVLSKSLTRGSYYRGFFEQNAAYYSLAMQTLIAGFPPEGRTLDYQAIIESYREFEAGLNGGFPPYRVLARIAIPNVSKATATAAKKQSLLDQLNLACALERFRLAQGGYPERLAGLTPEYVKSFPVDVADGMPLRYRLLENGEYRLWAIGMDGQDDGGVAGRDAKGGKRWMSDSGDWPWSLEPEMAVH